MESEGAFGDAVKGATGIAHAATPVMRSFDPNEAVPIIDDKTWNGGCKCSLGGPPPV